MTLAVAEHMDDAVNDALRPLLRALPMRCTIGAPMLFGRGPFTLVRLVIPSAELLALQAEVHKVCLPHMSPGPLPHADPGQWTPHVTLARRVARDKLADALSLRRHVRATGGVWPSAFGTGTATTVWSTRSLRSFPDDSGSWLSHAG